MVGLPTVFEKNLLDIFGFRVPRKIALAVSGGVDSMALTSLMAKWAQSRGTQLKALVVDHNLRLGSNEEAQLVSKYVESTFGIPATVLSLTTVDPQSTKLEELARLGRRKLIFEACAHDKIHTLALGHHLNDQIELFVQRFLKRSSWYGLAGMRPSAPSKLSVHHRTRALNQIRPFLNVPKQALIDWCAEQKIQWWEDPTNADPKLTSRNLVRQMYTLNQAPPSFSAPKVEQLLTLFNRQRQEVFDTANLVLEQLKISGAFVVNDSFKTAQLKVSKELSDLPPAIQTEILYRIVAPLSPKSDDLITKRRSNLSGLASKLSQGNHRFQHNVLGVLIRGTSHGWFFNREPLRGSELAHWEIHKATAQWSDFRSVDNRWYFRWRLTPQAGKNYDSPRYFSISFLSKPEPVLKPLIAALHVEKMKKIKQYVPLHPFLMWSDPLDPSSITPGKIIGFPTLNLVVNGLDLEVLPKECVF